MTVKHNYISTANTKPTAVEIARYELVINGADGSLWSKNSADNVIQVGGMVGDGYVDVSSDQDIGGIKRFTAGMQSLSINMIRTGSIDWNNFLNSGHFNCSDSDLNLPGSIGDGSTILVKAWDVNAITQQVHSYSQNTIYIRTKADGWNPWVVVTTSPILLQARISDLQDYRADLVANGLTTVNLDAKILALSGA